MKLIYFLVLSLIIMSINVTNSFAFQTQGGVGPPQFHIGDPVHQNITREGLPFLNLEVLDNIVAQHIEMEGDQSIYNHFDGCAFQTTTQNIQSLQADALGLLQNPHDETYFDASTSFGKSLHPIQDFYAHSNWIELEQGDLIDKSLSPWTVLQPMTQINGIYVVEKDPEFTDYEFANHNKIIEVTLDSQIIGQGIVTGRFHLVNDRFAVHNCPEGAILSHGGPFIYNNNDLSKDKSNRLGFDEARRLAVEQTTHEFCRLGEMLLQTGGQDSVEYLFNNWVSDNDAALAACSNVGYCGSDATFRVPLSNLNAVDSFGNSLSSTNIGSSVGIRSDMGNTCVSLSQPFTYIVQVKNSSGSIESLAWLSGNLSSGQSFAPSTGITLEHAGTYTIEVYLWKSLDNPTVLSDILSTTITITE